MISLSFKNIANWQKIWIHYIHGRLSYKIERRLKSVFPFDHLLYFILLNRTLIVQTLRLAHLIWYNIIFAEFLSNCDRNLKCFHIWRQVLLVPIQLISVLFSKKFHHSISIYQIYGTCKFNCVNWFVYTLIAFLGGKKILRIRASHTEQKFIKTRNKNPISSLSSILQCN